MYVEKSRNIFWFNIRLAERKFESNVIMHGVMREKWYKVVPETQKYLTRHK